MYELGLYLSSYVWIMEYKFEVTSLEGQTFGIFLKDTFQTNMLRLNTFLQSEFN